MIDLSWTYLIIFSKKSAIYGFTLSQAVVLSSIDYTLW
jgi:hypothetical protein